MARPLRLSFEDAVYHITARGNRRENIYNSERDKEVFLKKMGETFERYSINCYAYCLMDNHYHLFIRTKDGNISKAMHYLNTSYSNWFKAKHKIVGVIFQGRYKSIVVDADNYALMLSAYIHLNPLRANIVDKLEDYNWSSYRDYIGDRKPSIKNLDTWFILGQLDNDLSKARQKYRRFVLENAGMDNPLEDVYSGIALGKGDFIEEVKKKIGIKGRDREISETRFAGSYMPDDVIKTISERYGITETEIFRRSRNNIYRKLAIYLLKEKTPLKLKEIGEMFDIDYVTVSSTAIRFQKEIEKDKEIRKMRDKVIEVQNAKT